MRIAITGDSFTHTYHNTWLETICKNLNLELVNSYGFRGESQYKIYENFLQLLTKQIDIILICHTEYLRLYNEGIADKNFAITIQKLLIADMQEKCKLKNIKMINIPCFEHEIIDKNYGLWFLSPDGLISCSKADAPEWKDIMDDKRINHFSKKGHEIMANNIIPHIKTYINTDQQFHIVNLYPEYFA
jgi:hypothetical protein